MVYVISYDISIDKRRARIAKLLEGHGQRVQWSVFECDLTEREYSVLWRKLIHLLKPDEGDSVRIYRLCGACAGTVEIIGPGPPLERSLDTYII